MRNKIFISHANPHDNGAARWLGLQLMTLGYEVWCDVFNLKGGEKFWKEIEEEIRNNTCKFLLILTHKSNQSDGCLNELEVAESVNKLVEDNRFIITLMFDPELNYDEINIKLKRKLHLNFKKDWQQGLKDLLNIFQDDPKTPVKDSPNFNFIQKYWQSIYLDARSAIQREEVYTSNWFPFVRFPENLYLHDFRGMIPKKHNLTTMPYATIGYKKLTATFAWCYDFITEMPATEKYDPTNTRRFSVAAILNGEAGDDFISNRTLRNIINNLITNNFIATVSRRGLLKFDMSDKVAFCFVEDVNEQTRFPFGQLVGKIKDRTWHFAFSGFPDLSQGVFVFRTHILLSDDTGLIKSKRIQQSGRRKQGKNWWNRHWRQKLMSAVSQLTDEEGNIKIEVGTDECILISGTPVEFLSKYSYNDPDDSKESLGDDINDDEDEEIENAQ